MPILRPCKNTAAFEVIPDRGDLKLDVSALQPKLEAEGWHTVANAVVMLIVRRAFAGAEGEVELSIYRSGKLLIKTRQPEVAKAVYDAAWPHIDPDADEIRIEGLDRLARSN